MMRNVAETDVPMMAPILLNAPNLELMAEAVAATTMDVMMTILMEGDKFSEPYPTNKRILRFVTKRKDER